MNPEIEAEYRAKLRALLAEAYPLLPVGDRSTYSKIDYDKAYHIVGGPCEWIIPSGQVVREEQHYEFVGTDCDSELRTTIVASGVNCKCGLLTDEEVQVEVTFSEVLEQVVGGPPSREETL